jgi:hypothetical protein
MQGNKTERLIPMAKTADPVGEKDTLYRPEFVAALELLGRVCQRMVTTNPDTILPILVGGAVVEFDTAGQLHSGDFDFAGGSMIEFGTALEQEGFIQDKRHGRLHRPAGWYHPNQLIGVELVSGSLFDGRTDRSRLRVVSVNGGAITLAPTEDLIADRMGQWAANPTDRSMLEQAILLLRLAETLDQSYLDVRIRQETTEDFGLADLERLSSKR